MSKLILLPKDFNIGVIHDVTDEVKNLISSEDEITMDAKEIETIDILGLQLLLSVIKTVLNSNIKLRIININPELQNYFSLASLPLGENLTISKSDISKLKYTKDM